MRPLVQYSEDSPSGGSMPFLWPVRRGDIAVNECEGITTRCTDKLANSCLLLIDGFRCIISECLVILFAM